MKNQVKKISAVLITLLFSLSTFAIVSAESVQDDDAIELIDTIVYRYGPFGITPISVQVPVKEGADILEIEDAIFKKCVELAEQDEEIQKYLNETGDIDIVSFVKSRGRGLHFDMKIRIPVKRYMKKFPNLPPYYRFLKFPIVYAKYPRDTRATTTIRPQTGNETELVGPHSVSAYGFMGYTTWLGFIAKRGFILRCGFAGYALVTTYD